MHNLRQRGVKGCAGPLLTPRRDVRPPKRSVSAPCRTPSPGKGRKVYTAQTRSTLHINGVHSAGCSRWATLPHLKTPRLRPLWTLPKTTTEETEHRKQMACPLSESVLRPFLQTKSRGGCASLYLTPPHSNTLGPHHQFITRLCHCTQSDTPP